MSPELALFYKELQQWVSQGFPYDPTKFERYQFTTRTGLCINVVRWARKNKLPIFGLREELEKQFKEAGLDEVTPFDKNVVSYLESQEYRTLWQNPKRLEWVRNHVS